MAGLRVDYMTRTRIRYRWLVVGCDEGWIDGCMAVELCRWLARLFQPGLIGVGLRGWLPWPYNIDRVLAIPDWLFQLYKIDCFDLTMASK